MFIECWGHQPALYLWSFVMLFVYRCKREYYLSEFKVLFIIYGKAYCIRNQIVNILKRPLSRGDCSYSLCIRANNITIPISFILLCSLRYCTLKVPYFQKFQSENIRAIYVLRLCQHFVLTYKPLNRRLLVLKCTTNIYWQNVFSIWTILGVRLPCDMQALSTVALANVNKTSVSSLFHLQQLVFIYCFF